MYIYVYIYICTFTYAHIYTHADIISVYNRLRDTGFAVSQIPTITEETAVALGSASWLRVTVT